MTLLTDKQREEVVEAMARAILQEASDTGPLVHRSALEGRLAHAALTAALPAIERAVLERAAGLAEGPAVAWGDHLGGTPERVRIARAIRALAGEVG